MSFCSKVAPYVDTVVQPNGYTTNTAGVRSRNSAYDSSKQYLKDRLYSSVKTPGFKQLKPQNRPINPFQAYTGIVTDTFCIVGKPGADKRKWEGFSRMVVGTSHSALLNVRNQAWYDSTVPVYNNAVLALLDRVSNTKVNLGQAFMERRQTANMLVNTVNRFVTFTVLFRKGKFVEANRILQSRKQYFVRDPREREFLLRSSNEVANRHFKKNLLRRPTHNEFSNLWLEYSYGWRPLVADVYGAAELLAETHLDNRETEARGKALQTKDFTYKYTTEGLTGSAKLTRVSKYDIKAAFTVEDAWLDKLKSTGLVNPLNLAWELLPYSFVVDWFIPVGSYLNAVTATAGLKFKRGSVSYRCSFDATAYSSTDNSRWTLSNPAVMGYEYEETTRWLLTSWPSPSLPSLSLGLNGSRIASSFALLSQIFRR